MMSEDNHPANSATMRDVAALAGVSVTTVSRVVNGQPSVSPMREELVRAAIERLGYRRQPVASGVGREGWRSHSIGLLVEDVSDAFSSRLHRSVEKVAHERGVIALALSCDDDPLREQEALAAFLARRVDGVIAMPALGDHSHLRAEHEAGIPIVAVDRVPAFPGIDVVTVDNEAGARRGVEHLLAHGHRRIGFLGDLPTITTADQRYAGYRAALRGAGIPPDPALIVRGVRGTEQATAAATGLLRSHGRPTALFSAQNSITIGTIEALRALGRHHEVAVVGFDDFFLADLLDPGITVVAQDPAELGRLAARRLFARIDGDSSPPHRDVVRTRLIVRGSGELEVSRAPDRRRNNDRLTRGATARQ
jgi:LacI family transcriptional regulator